jgi:hypothetical protein
MTSTYSAALKEYGKEYSRCGFSQTPHHHNLSENHLFQYTEFTSYAALLSGAPPHFMQNILVAQHKQTWRLREYYLYGSSFPSDTSLQCGNEDSDPEPVASGNALHAYFPIGIHIEETEKGLKIMVSGKKPLLYEHADLQDKNRTTKMETKRRIIDIIITGEGHSSWGEFRLTGRVRPCDGFISLSKDYVCFPPLFLFS